MTIESFAKIKDVPVFRAGTHNGLTFSDTEIDAMISDTNEALPFLMESMQAGAYRENPHLQGVKGIPAFLNLGHQKFLPESLKELVKDVSVKFHKQGDWIAATFDNVRSDVAEFLKERFPLRSVEIIPRLFNPLTGREYKNVIRSVAFLPGDIPPAVAGQSPDLAIEFEAAPILTAYSRIDEGESIMKDEETKAEMNADAAKAVQLAEFQALQTQIKEFEQRLSAAETEKAEIQKRLTDAETVNRSKDIELFFDKLIHAHQVSPVFVEKAKPLFMQNHNGVITFGATEDALKAFAEWVAGNVDKVAVAIGEKAASEQDEPGDKPVQMQRDDALEAAAKELNLTLKDNYSQVWAFAARKHPELF